MHLREDARGLDDALRVGAEVADESDSPSVLAALVVLWKSAVASWWAGVRTVELFRLPTARTSS